MKNQEKNLVKLRQLKVRQQQILESELAKLNSELDKIYKRLEQVDQEIMANRNNKINYKKNFYKEATSGTKEGRDFSGFEFRLKEFDLNYQELQEIRGETCREIEECKEQISEVMQKIRALVVTQEKYDYLLVN